MSNKSLKQQFEELNEKIDKLNYLLTKFNSKIEKIQNQKLKNECHNFQNYYYKFLGLKRFSISVFGKISSGKSNLLNYLLPLHNIFETDYDISTKFICIIRHNPKIDKPNIYNINISERGEYENKKIKLWNFKKVMKF